MALADRNMITEKEFSPEQAGQRVGWAAVTEAGDSGDYFGAHFAAATVGENGASIQYELRDEDGEERKIRGWSDSVQGFDAVAGMSVFFSTSNSAEDQRYRDRHITTDDSYKGNQRSERAFNHGGDGHTDVEVISESRVWADNPAALMQIMKEMLTGRDMGQYYPVVYYTANLMVAHAAERERSSLSSVSVESTLMPDADMHTITEVQLALASEIVDSFSLQQTEDHEMAKNLTAYMAIPIAEIPASFVASRRKMHEAEAKASQAYKKLLSYGGVYLYTGDPSRSWPYMDAAETDEDKAFGAELHALEAQNLSLASREIKRELAELNGRYIYAQQGRHALSLLAAAELVGPSE